LLNLITTWLFMYLLSFMICIMAWYMPVSKQKTFKQVLKEIYYIPIIPIVNTLMIFVILFSIVYTDIKNKNWIFLRDMLIGAFILMAIFIVSVYTQRFWILFLIVIPQFYFMNKYKNK